MSERARQIECTAAAWLARRDGDHWSDDDQRAFDAWLDADTAHRVAFLRLDATWREAGRLAALAVGPHAGVVPARGAWRRSPYFRPETAVAPAASPDKVARRGRRSRHRPLMAAVAAVVLVAMVVGALSWQRGHEIVRGAWATAIGAQELVHLADGSTATLSGDTALRAELGRRERDIHLLRGEALFDVAPDHARPFVVHVRGYRVIAVGTRFDVRRDDDRLRVVVTRGLVRLQPAGGASRTTTELPAGSIADVGAAGVVVRHVPEESANDYLGWRDGYANFHDTPLVDAVSEFNRYNRPQIVIGDRSLDGLRVGGHFRLDNNAAFVRLLQAMFPVRAEIRSHDIVLLRASTARPDNQ